MRRKLIKHVLQGSQAGEETTVCGWVRTRRDSKGGFSFVEVNDGSCLGNLQVVAEVGLANYRSEVVRLHPGASVRIDGVLQESPGGGQRVELLARQIKVFGFSEPTEYPLGKQRVSFERLRPVNDGVLVVGWVSGKSLNLDDRVEDLQAGH